MNHLSTGTGARGPPKPATVRRAKTLANAKLPQFHVPDLAFGCACGQATNASPAPRDHEYWGGALQRLALDERSSTQGRCCSSQRRRGNGTSISSWLSSPTAKATLLGTHSGTTAQTHGRSGHHWAHILSHWECFRVRVDL